MAIARRPSGARWNCDCAISDASARRSVAFSSLALAIASVSRALMAKIIGGPRRLFDFADLGFAGGKCVSSVLAFTFQPSTRAASVSSCDCRVSGTCFRCSRLAGGFCAAFDQRFDPRAELSRRPVPAFDILFQRGAARHGLLAVARKVGQAATAFGFALARGVKTLRATLHGLFQLRQTFCILWLGRGLITLRVRCARSDSTRARFSFAAVGFQAGAVGLLFGAGKIAARLVEALSGILNVAAQLLLRSSSAPIRAPRALSVFAACSSDTFWRCGPSAACAASRRVPVAPDAQRPQRAPLVFG